MSQSRGSSRRKRKLKQAIFSFSNSVGLSPLRMLLSAFLLLGVGGFIYFLGFSNESLSRPEDTAVLTHDELLEEQDEIDKRLQTLFKQRIAHGGNFLLSINQIQDSETEISDLESSHSLTPSQEEMVARIRLKGKGGTVLQMLRNDILYDAERKDLFRFCESYCNDANESDIRSECRYWMCAVPTIEFSYAPSEETLAEFSVAIEEYEDCYLNSPTHSELLGQIMKTMITKNRNTSELTRKGMRRIAQRMLASETVGVRYTGEKLILLEVFGDYDLRTLGYRIAWNDPSAAADIKGAIDSLENNLNVVPLYVWNLIIHAYEGHLSSGNIEKVGVTWQRMWAISQQIESEHSRKQVQGQLKRQRDRALLIGKSFDLSGFRLKEGKPINFGGYEYIAIIFVNEESSSAELVKKIVIGGILNDCNLHSVFAFNRSYSQEEIQKLNDSRGDYTIADLETSRKYYEQLIVDDMPYIVLADKSGKILNSSLPLDQLETRVAQQKVSRSIDAPATP